MMHKSTKNSVGSAVFYRPLGPVTEVRSGYLFKSPPPNRWKTMKSWRWRYFVLSKTNQQEYQLKYFRNPEEMDRPLGEIDLTHISLLYVNPEHHQKWNWVQKNFKCSPNCVLYMRVSERDFFLAGKTSEEVDVWFSDLFDALQNRPYKFLTTEEITERRSTNEIVSYPLLRKKSFAMPSDKPLLKIRSMSDPSSNNLVNSTEKMEDDEYERRRSSEPLYPIYDYPKPVHPLKPAQVGENGTTHVKMESLYETMMEMKQGEETETADLEVAQMTASTLLRSVTQVYDKFTNQVSPLPESMGSRGRTRLMSDVSSGSSDNGAVSPVEIGDKHLEEKMSTESLDRMSLEERDIEVKQADLKKHLTLTEVDGKPSVSGWTGQPNNVCLFHKGDQILAINDLHTGNVEEFNMYLSKSLKSEVRVTILRQAGCPALHLPTCLCTG